MDDTFGVTCRAGGEHYDYRCVEWHLQEFQFLTPVPTQEVTPASCSRPESYIRGIITTLGIKEYELCAGQRFGAREDSEYALRNVVMFAIV